MRNTSHLKAFSFFRTTIRQVVGNGMGSEVFRQTLPPRSSFRPDLYWEDMVSRPSDSNLRRFLGLGNAHRRYHDIEMAGADFASPESLTICCPGKTGVHRAPADSDLCSGNSHAVLSSAKSKGMESRMSCSSQHIRIRPFAISIVSRSLSFNAMAMEWISILPLP